MKLTSFLFMVYAFGILYKESLPAQSHKDILLYFVLEVFDFAFHICAFLLFSWLPPLLERGHERLILFHIDPQRPAMSLAPNKGSMTEEIIKGLMVETK